LFCASGGDHCFRKGVLSLLPSQPARRLRRATCLGNSVAAKERIVSYPVGWEK